MTSTTSRPTTTPTPTDRLAQEIRKSRLFLHAHVAAAETKLNALLTSVLHLEQDFTQTIASLAPAPQTGEQVMPGALYVLVAGMTGSIMTRNRNILLRATVPAAIGIGAAWVVLPVTMRNVADLAWRYEKRFPRVAQSHLEARERIEKIWATARAHSSMSRGLVEEKLAEGRQTLEGWVRGAGGR